MDKLKIRVLLCVLLATAILITGCDDDECKACNDAIGHMAGKIMEQGCNPNTMQNAWDRIREDCDHPDAAVGVLAETCNLERMGEGTIIRPGCNLPGLNLEASEIPIILFIYNRKDPKFFEQFLDIIIEIPRAVFRFEIDLPANGGPVTHTVFLDEVVTEGDLIKVEVKRRGEDVLFGEASKNFTYARMNNWGTFRFVTIDFGDPDQPFIEFGNF